MSQPEEETFQCTKLSATMCHFTALALVGELHNPGMTAPLTTLFGGGKPNRQSTQAMAGRRTVADGASHRVTRGGGGRPGKGVV